MLIENVEGSGLQTWRTLERINPRKNDNVTMFTRQRNEELYEGLAFSNVCSLPNVLEVNETGKIKYDHDGRAWPFD